MTDSSTLPLFRDIRLMFHSLSKLPRSIGLFLLTYVFVAFATSSVFGQAAANMVTEFKGTLKLAKPGVIVIAKEDSTEAMVAFPDNISNFNFVAEAKPAFLGPGMLVRYTGVFDGAGNPLSPIEKVEIFQPVNVQSIQGHMRNEFTPGVHGDAHASKNQGVAPAKYSVVGAPMGISPTGMMVVQAGKIPVRCQLAPNVKFEIRLNNLSLAQPGDAVSVTGFYEPPDELKVKAERITITTDRVYGEPTERVNPRARRDRNAKPEAKGEEAKGEEAKGEEAKDEEAKAEEIKN